MSLPVPTFAKVEAASARIIQDYPELVEKYRHGSHKVIGFLMAKTIMEFPQARPDPWHVKAAVEAGLMRALARTA